MIQTKTKTIAVVLIAIATIGATGTIGLLTQHVLAQPCFTCHPPPVAETNPDHGNPHPAGEPQGNPHQFTANCGGNPHGQTPSLGGSIQQCSGAN